jgi:dipeptidyl aminopeptidase/acylaminoacyl peptidase
MESRPNDGGRQVVVGVRPATGSPQDVSPIGTSVRSRVHEYGGAAATVVDGVLFYVDQADQRWYRVPVGHDVPPLALTPEPSVGSVRHADGRLTSSGRWLISMEETVDGSVTSHRLVAVPVDGTLSVVPVVSGPDFVSAPRPSPDGRWLAWVAWDHPAMPWDSSELWVGALDESAGTVTVGEARRVAGGPGVSVGQPRWCRDGALVFVDDRSGWWLPYRMAADRLGGGDRSECLVDGASEFHQSEFHAPDWVCGQSTVAELADGSLVCRRRDGDGDHLVRLCPPAGPDLPWSLETIVQPCLSITGVAVVGDDNATAGGGDGQRICVLGSTPTEAYGVVDVSSTPAHRLSSGPEPPQPTEVSVAERFVAPTPSGPVPGLLFRPTNPAVPGPPAGRPPLVVFCHGGPTGAAEPGFDPLVQFFTSRGLAVAFVDYRGSSGYGRAYRRALDGRWGEADVDDCVQAAEALAAGGVVDGARMAIRGTSAGGMTALAALIRSRRFRGAASWYGVTDLEALVADTHDFESRYLDTLVGPWPAAASRYRSRSPIHHPDQVVGAVLLLQGEEDPIVPVDQARRFAEQLDRHGVSRELVVFAGESHGFRRAETTEACLTAELAFYRALFAPDPAPDAAGRSA